MNKFNLALLVAVACGAMFTIVRPANATIEYPWCAQYDSEEGGGRNCGFSTYEQCMETARGMGNDCQPNSFYNPASAPARKPARRRAKSGDTPR